MEPMRRTLLGFTAALLLTAGAGCTVTQKDPGYVPPAPRPVLEQLAQGPLADANAYAAGPDILSFATADRNLVCALTSARGEHFNLPYEQNSFADSANNKLATAPVAHCELAVYPKPEAKDVADNCGATGLGYLGGAALLTPAKASYGECRSGVTQQEAAFGPKGNRSGPIAQLPVLEDGKTVERNGLRCAAYNGGVACGNVSAGVAFFVSRDRYELIPDTGDPAVPNPPDASKSP
jgi:predicted small lipoprotein YifL